MASVKQRRDEVDVRVSTAECRLYGKIHLLPGRSTADLFNLEQREFVPLTEVQIFSPGLSHPPRQDEVRARLPFLGLNRHSVLWIVGGRPKEMPASTVREVRVAFLFSCHLFTGMIQVPAAQRVSDHLYTAKTFHTLFKARLFPLSDGTPFAELKPVESFDFVTLNTARVLAVTEA